MNVILVIFDSLREDCIECLGEPPWGKVFTPNLNKFAKESFIIKRCYPESLPTLPARRAIYTGKRVYPFEKDLRLRGDFLGAPGWGPISEDNETISEILQENGYTTALISDIQHMFKPSKNFHRGFDEWIWVRGYEIDPYRSGPLPKKEEIDRWLPKELQSREYVSFIKQCLMNMHGRSKEEDYFVAKVMREAIRWIEQNQDKEDKFLLIESWSPHEPWFVPEKYRKMYLKEDYPQQVISPYRDITDLPDDIIKSTQANYSGLVTMCDRWFGYLYEAISSLNMLDNTLIIVTTDHGHSIGDNGYLGKRGYPSSPEVYNIPIFLRYPDNKFGRGIESNILVQHTDITATILDIIGVKAERSNFYKWNYFMNYEKYDTGQEEIDMHGKSFFKALVENDNNFRDHVTVAWGSAVTVITDDWWFNCRVNGKGTFLYDLADEDPFGQNVAGSNPKVIKELFKLAVEDAGGRFPDYLMRLADNEEDAPGCSELVAR